MLEYTPASTLWKVKPPIVKAPLQSSGVVGVISPSDSAASATIGLNVDPVGYRPCVAWFSSGGVAPWFPYSELRDARLPPAAGRLVPRAPTPAGAPPGRGLIPAPPPPPPPG